MSTPATVGLRRKIRSGITPTSVMDLTLLPPNNDSDNNTIKRMSENYSVVPNDNNEMGNHTMEEQDTTSEEDEANVNETAAVIATSSKCQIVGIRYYTGVAHAGEYVTLVREPTNPYDSNAIRVDNLAGHKVGHLKRQQAALLAPLMDQQQAAAAAPNNNHGLSWMATIPYAGNEYTMPCTIDFVLTANRQEWQSQAVACAAQLKGLFKTKCGFHSRISTRTNQKKETAKPESDKAAVKVENHIMDWTRQAQELDQLFEQQAKDQLARCPKLDMPLGEKLNTGLLKYQQEGVQWLVHQESKPQLPFHQKKKENGKSVWHCTISNSSQTNAPQGFRGGILSDEMGLGKTLQMLTLMVAAPADTGKPAATLVVCPVSVMSNWETQIETHVKEGVLKVGFYRGTHRNKLLEEIRTGDINVVLVSYHTLAAECTKVFGKKDDDNDDNKNKNAKKKPKVDTIFHVPFHRIILDEAHTIRRRQTSFFRACTRIQAERKWALTGTPLVNRAEDVGSLLAFLGVEPLADKQIFQRAIAIPMESGDNKGLATLRLCMAHVALRRSKMTAGVSLVKKTVHLSKVSFDGSLHKQVYAALFGTVRRAFEAVLQEGNALKHYSNIFETLLRLRQACCSALLVPSERRTRALQLWQELQDASHKLQLTAEEGLALLEKLKGAFESTDATLPECAVCLMEMEEAQCVILRGCSHVYCQACIGRVCESSAYERKCPLCRQRFDNADMIHKQDASKAAATQGDGETKTSTAMNGETLGKSPKILALLGGIQTMKPDEKGVIFSQFTGFLDLIGPALQEAGHTFTRLDGSMPAAKRSDAVRTFSSDEADSPRFILCSLHAAGTGIDLKRGNVAFLMDSFWNAATEQQAMDRIHRLGQSREVQIHRFVMKSSIEENMIALQEAKSMQAKGLMQKLKPDEQRKARLQELKGLLSIETDSV